MSSNFQMKVGAGIAALAIVVAGGGYYFFHVRADSPDTAIKATAKSIEKHDVTEFHRAVNVDSLLDSGYSGLVDGVTSFDNTMPPDARDAIKGFTEMLRDPMIITLKSAIDSYVATGSLDPQKNVGVPEIVERIGLNDVEIRNVKNIQRNDADRNEAFADVIIFQRELGREFPLHIVLNRVEEEHWQITRVQNFQEYVAEINQARRTQLEDYLAKAVEINNRHDTAIREAEQKYGSILSTGNLGQDLTRDNLQTLFNEFIKPDWELRKQELSALTVPKSAEPLHNLYMQICDLSIDYAQDYANWLEDKTIDSIKSAEDKLHHAQALSSEAADLAKRMTT